MLSGFIIAVALVLGGLAVMRFGIFQIRKFKKGETVDCFFPNQSNNNFL